MSFKIVAACLSVLFLAGCAKVSMFEPDQHAVPDGHLALKSPVTPPYAFTHFCLRYADECRVHDANFKTAYDQSDDNLIIVNEDVNHAISPNDDKTNMGFDAWRIAPASGNCNDYAVTKRHELLDLGWPSRALLLAEVVTRQGEHHLVLIVRSAKSDLVLDNLSPDIRDWSDTSYQWVRMQSPDNPQTWVSISNA